MAHGNLRRTVFIGRIIIPWDNIHVLCPHLIIERFIKSHQIRCDRNIRCNCFEGIILSLITLQNTFRIKSFIIHSNSLKLASILLKMLTQKIWQYNLIPVIEGMSPECCIPCAVYVFNRLIFLFQPDTKCFLTVFTITFPPKFIGNVPCYNIIVIPVPLCNFLCQPDRILLIGRTVRAGIVSSPEFSF